MDRITPGVEVIFRDLKWEVIDVFSSGEDEIVRLRGGEGVVIGKEIEAIRSLEPITPIAFDINPEKASRLQHWTLFHQAYLLEQSAGDDALLSVNSGRIKPEPYQIVPLMRALKMSRPRLLLCDDVGLGKTIQAAQIIIELMARRIAHRVLIVSPAGPLLDQWKQELLDKFSIKVEIIDKDKLDEVKRKNELGANPFDTIPLGLISIDFLKQEKILEYVEKSSYDIIVIDEAHHCSETNSGSFEESQRRKLACVLATRCDYLLLLTATPHNGIDRSFSSLLELLDPSLVNGKGEAIADKYKAHVVRRLKRHIKDHETGAPKFKERNLQPIPVIAEPGKHKNYIEFQKELLELISPELRKALRNRNYGDVLAFIALLKRSVSTVSSCVETLGAIKNRFEGLTSERKEERECKQERVKSIRDLMKKAEKFGVLSCEEEEEQRNLHIEDIAGQLKELESELRSGSRKLKHAQNVTGYLEELIKLGEKTLDNDPKIEAIIREINNIRSSEPNANILIYTEYIDSQTAVVNALLKKIDSGILTLSGSDPDHLRKKVTIEFSTYEGRILVSTDASSEGLNLQKKCHHLIHLELPFNPNRLEQRNGRIDRYGQEITPQIRYLFLKNTFEDRILIKLIAKYERQRKLLGFVPETLGITCTTDAACEKLLKGFVSEEDKLFKDSGENLSFDFFEPEKEAESDESIKELMSEIDKSFGIYKTSSDSKISILETGVNNDSQFVSLAADASKNAGKYNMMGLLKFVTSAVSFDGGSDKLKKGITEIKLPQTWEFALEDLPGYDKDAHLIRLTEDLGITEDENKMAVGYLGRSHPIVKKAIERVKSIGFIMNNTARSDPRVTAIRDKVKKPKILYTFSGIIQSKKQKIYEIVFAITVDKEGNIDEIHDAAELTQYAKIEKAIDASGIWERHFKIWAADVGKNINAKAESVFGPKADKFFSDHIKKLEKEKYELTDRFNKRVWELTGGVNTESQIDLFETPDAKARSIWIEIEEPRERLLKFSQDKGVFRSKRSTADTVLKNYSERMKVLEMLSEVDFKGIRQLGMMMIISEGEI